VKIRREARQKKWSLNAWLAKSAISIVENRTHHAILFSARNTRYNVGHIPSTVRPNTSTSSSAAAEPKGSRTHMPRENQTAQEQPLVRFGLGLANWSERWFPDPLIFALLGIVVVFVVGLLLHQSPAKLAIQGGKNFWTLVPFTMQMVMIIIGGYVVASTPIVYRAIRALAGIPKTPRGAVALVALFSMLTSLISWGLSLIFSGLFVRELAHRVKGNGLPRRGRCRVSRDGSGLGDGALVLRRHADGDQVLHAAILVQH
jgi:hypothetical protein